MTRERDYAYEALAEVSGTDVNAGRGELNVSLKSIREQCELEDSYLLAAEIHERAKLYRQVMGSEIMLTAPALAKHWKRIVQETEQRKVRTFDEPPSKCPTCDGHHVVLVATRPVSLGVWQVRHGIEPVAGAQVEEYACCPDCNTVADVSFWRTNGTQFRAPDPARVRELMRR